MNPQRLETLLQMFNKKAPIARHLGMKLSFSDDHRAVVDLPYNRELDHSFGCVHGGIYATLLDCAGWFTAAATRDISCWMATSEMSIHYLLPVKESALRATANVIKRGKRQDVVEMRLYDENEQLVAHAMATFIVLESVEM